MWNNYFFQIQKKYDMRISTKEPFVIRFDGKKVTRNKEIDLLDMYEGSFFDKLLKTANMFSEKYNCYALFGADEISFIIPNPVLVINDLEGDDNSNYSHELLALFTQNFFDYFNHFDTSKKIFWHGKCFSISHDKIISYIRYRTTIIKNVMVTYLLKKNNLNSSLTLLKKEEMCKGLPEYFNFNKIKNGILCFNGEKISLSDFINNGIVIKEETGEIEEKQVSIDIDDIEIDMLD